MNIHLPEKNLCETSVNKVKEKIGFGEITSHIMSTVMYVVLYTLMIKTLLNVKHRLALEQDQMMKV